MCKPLPTAASNCDSSVHSGGQYSGCPLLAASSQGLTLVHFLSQRKRLLWNRGCIQGVFKGCLAGVMGYQEEFWGVICVTNGSS